MTVTELEYCKGVMGSYAALARSGAYVEVMRSYCKGEISLDEQDIRTLRGIFMPYGFETWEHWLSFYGYVAPSFDSESRFTAIIGRQVWPYLGAA